MSAIKLSAFIGEQPRIAPRLLPPTAATSAIGARLDDGGLTPYRNPTLATSLADGPFNSIVLHGSEWLGFEGIVNAAPGPVAGNRLYYTGDGVPKMRVGEDTYELALARPSAAPTATLGGSGSGDISTRVYVYTFVTEFGEESEPSPVSNEVDWQPGRTVTLSGIENPPSGRGFTHQRFYRSQTGAMGTDLYFIAERAASSSNFTDDLPVNEFAEPLPSRHWNPPPDNLAGLTALPNGMMAGFVGKRLYFCEPYRPHAWPEAYVLTLNFPIVALAAMGTMLWALTEGEPYRIVGTTPETMVAEKVEANLPCVSARGVVDLGHAVAWPSHDGLAVARADGSVQLASANLFSPRHWRRLTPGTMRAGQLNGRWIGSYAGTDRQGLPLSGSLIIDLSGEAYLIRSPIEARAWHYNVNDGFLYFLDFSGNQVMLFDSPSGDTAQFTWRSKPFILPKPDTMACILVESGALVSQDQIDARQEAIQDAITAREAMLALGPVGGEMAGEAIGVVPVAGDLLPPIPPSIGSEITVSIYADNELVGVVGTLDRIMRLPAGFLARIWEVDVFSDISVDQITLASSIDEMRQVGGGP